MNKSKLKRIRKEFDKTYQSGQYWEWLRLVEKEGLKSSYNQQWAEAWKKLVQRSFRLPRHLGEFFDRAEAFKSFPVFPDLTLLLLLKLQRDGKDVSQDLSALTGLSPQGNAFRERALAWNEGLFKKEKIEGTLTALITLPEQADKKNYDHLALLTEGTELSDPVRRLGEGIKKLRKVIGPGGLKKSLTQAKIRTLEEVDRLVEDVSQKCPASLFPILVYPHLHQLSHFLKIKSEKDSYFLMAKLIPVFPFLFDRLVGDKAEEIRSGFWGFHKSLISPQAISGLAQEVSKADFEGKVILLGRVRSLVQKSGSDELLALFQDLYRDVLAGVSEKAAQLEARQQKELSVILSPVIRRDLDLLREGEESYGDLSKLAGFMKAVGQSGCLDRKLALLALITAEKKKDRKLSETALQVLTGPERPKQEDLQWVLDFLGEEIFPYVGILKPLTGFFSQEPNQLDYIFGYLMNRLDFYLMLGSEKSSRDLFDDFLIGDPFFGEGGKEIIAVTRNELSSFRDDPVFPAILDYLKCFPENVFTPKGYDRYLSLTLQNRKNLVPILDHLKDLGQKITLLEETGPSEAGASSLGYLLETKKQVLIKFIIERLESLKEVPLQKIEEVIACVGNEMAHKDKGTFLIRLSNILSEKIKEGEKEAGPLKNQVLDMLARIKRRF